MWTSILIGIWQAEVRMLQDLRIWVLSHFLKEKMGDLKALSVISISQGTESMPTSKALLFRNLSYF